jgi:D-alanyl-D-alanine carboxypeptidase
MTRRKLGIAGAALIGLPALLALAAPAAPARPGTSLLRETQALLRKGVPGAVVVVARPGATTRIAVGTDLAGARRPMLAGDRFRIGSITKTFIATVVLQLAEEHRLSLDDTVERWLPGLVPNGRRITVRQLLQHTSGLFDYAADPATFRPFATDPGHAWRPRELVAIANRHAPNFSPGKGWGYSNTNYVLLGLIVETVTRTPVGHQLEQRIFRPLHLWATSFDGDGHFSDRSNGHRIARFAHGYSTIAGKTFDASDLNPSWGYAAGAITSTADDLVTFYRALMRGRLVGRQSLKAMETTLAIGPKGGYGLGLLRLRTSCGTFWGHDGGTFGYTSNAFVSGDGERAAIVFVNSGQLTPTQRDAFNRLAERAACDSKGGRPTRSPASLRLRRRP